MAWEEVLSNLTSQRAETGEIIPKTSREEASREEAQGRGEAQRRGEARRGETRRLRVEVLMVGAGHGAAQHVWCVSVRRIVVRGAVVHERVVRGAWCCVR